MYNWRYDPKAPRDREEVKTYGLDLLPQEGIAMVAGASNTGKSTWLLAMLHQWGYIWWSDEYTCWTLDLPKAWYFAFEDADNMRNAVDGFEATYTEMLDACYPEWKCRRIREGVYASPEGECSLFTPPAGTLDLASSGSYRSPGSVDEFFEAMEKLYRSGELEDDDAPDILVLDNMSLCIGDADENESIAARKIFQGLERIRKQSKARLVILVHHTTHGTNKPRGSEVLFNLMQGVVILSGTGETVTATCTKMKGSQRGAVRKYRRTVKLGPCTTYVDFEDITDAPAKPSKPVSTAPARFASPAPAEALHAPVPAPEASPALSVPRHPAEVLKADSWAGKLWAVLALKSGQGITVEDAKVKALAHPTFTSLPKNRASKFTDALRGLQRAGLADVARITNPA